MLARGWWLMASALFLSGCAQLECPTLRAAPAATNQPFGGPCVASSDCVEGLECLPYAGTLSLCSRPISRSGSNECPPGTGVRLFNRNGNEEGLCMRACEPDGSCQTGGVMSRCATESCSPIFCSTRGTQPNDGCPDGSFCAGEACIETVENGRITGIGITGGWCYRVP